MSRSLGITSWYVQVLVWRSWLSRCLSRRFEGSMMLMWRGLRKLARLEGRLWLLWPICIRSSNGIVSTKHSKTKIDTPHLGSRHQSNPASINSRLTPSSPLQHLSPKNRSVTDAYRSTQWSLPKAALALSWLIWSWSTLLVWKLPSAKPSTHVCLI